MPSPRAESEERAATLSLLVSSATNARSRRARSPHRRDIARARSPAWAPGGITYAEIVKGAASRSSSRGSVARPLPTPSPPDLRESIEIKQDEYNVDPSDVENSQLINRVSVVIESCAVSERDDVEPQVYKTQSETDQVYYDNYPHAETNVQLHYEPPTQYLEQDTATQDWQESQPDDNKKDIGLTQELQIPQCEDRALSPTRYRSQEMSYAEILALGLRRQSKTHSLAVLPKPHVAEVELVKEIVVECVEKPQIMAYEPKVERIDTKLKPERSERMPTRSKSRDMPRQKRASEKRPTKVHDSQVVKRKKTTKKVVEVQDFDEPEQISSEDLQTSLPTKIMKTTMDLPKEVSKITQHSPTKDNIIPETIQEVYVEQKIITDEVEHKKKKKSKTKKQKLPEDEIVRALKEIEEHDRKKKKARDKEISVSHFQTKDSSDSDKNPESLTDVSQPIQKNKEHNKRDSSSEKLTIETTTSSLVGKTKETKKKKKTKHIETPLTSVPLGTQPPLNILELQHGNITTEISEMSSWESICKSYESKQISESKVINEMCTQKMNEKMRKNSYEKAQSIPLMDVEKYEDVTKFSDHELRESSSETDKKYNNSTYNTKLPANMSTEISKECKSESDQSGQISETKVSDVVDIAHELSETTSECHASSIFAPLNWAEEVDVSVEEGKRPESFQKTPAPTHSSDIKDQVVLIEAVVEQNYPPYVDSNKKIGHEVKKKKKSKKSEKDSENVSYERTIENTTTTECITESAVVKEIKINVEKDDEQKNKKKKSKKEKNNKEKPESVAKSVDTNVAKISTVAEVIPITVNQEIIETSKTNKETKLKVQDEPISEQQIYDKVDYSPVSMQKNDVELKISKKKKPKKTKVEYDDITRALKEIEKAEGAKKKTKDKIYKSKEKLKSVVHDEPKEGIKAQHTEKIISLENIDWSKLVPEIGSMSKVSTKPLRQPIIDSKIENEERVSNDSTSKDTSGILITEKNKTNTQEVNIIETDVIKTMIEAAKETSSTVNIGTFSENQTSYYKDKQQTLPTDSEQNNNEKCLKDGSINIIEEITTYEPAAEDIETTTIYLITHEEKKLPPIRTMKMFRSKSNSLEKQLHSTPITSLTTEDSLEESRNIKSLEEFEYDLAKTNKTIKIVESTLIETEPELLFEEKTNKITAEKSSIENYETNVIDELKLPKEPLETNDSTIDVSNPGITQEPHMISEENLKQDTNRNVTKLESEVITDDDFNSILEQAIFGSVQNRNKNDNNEKDSNIPYEELINDVKTYSLELDSSQLDYDYYRYIVNKTESPTIKDKSVCDPDIVSTKLPEHSLSTVDSETSLKIDESIKPDVENKMQFSNAHEIKTVIIKQQGKDVNKSVDDKNELRVFNTKLSDDKPESDALYINLNISDITMEKTETDISEDKNEIVKDRIVQSIDFVSAESILSKSNDEIDCSVPITTTDLTKLNTEKTVTSTVSTTSTTPDSVNPTELETSKVPTSTDQLTSGIHTNEVINENILRYSYHEIVDAEKELAFSRSFNKSLSNTPTEDIALAVPSIDQYEVVEEKELKEHTEPTATQKVVDTALVKPENTILEVPRYNYSEIADAEIYMIKIKQSSELKDVIESSNANNDPSLPVQFSLNIEIPIMDSPSVGYHEINDAEHLLATVLSRETSKETTPETEREIERSPARESDIVNIETQNDEIYEIPFSETRDDSPLTNGVVLGPISLESIDREELEIHVNNIEPDVESFRENIYEIPSYRYQDLNDAEQLYGIRNSVERSVVSLNEIRTTENTLITEDTELGAHSIILSETTNIIPDTSIENNDSPLQEVPALTNSEGVFIVTQKNILEEIKENLKRDWIQEPLSYSYHQIQDAECILAEQMTSNYQTQKLISDVVTDVKEYESNKNEIPTSKQSSTSNTLETTEKSYLLENSILKQQKIDFAFEVDDLSNTPIAVEYAKEDLDSVMEPSVQFYVETPTPTKETNIVMNIPEEKTHGIVSADAEDFELLDVKEIETLRKETELSNDDVNNLASHDDNLSQKPSATDVKVLDINIDDMSFEIIDINDAIDLVTEQAGQVKGNINNEICVSDSNKCEFVTIGSKDNERGSFDLSFTIDDLDESLVPMIFGDIKQVEKSLMERNARKVVGNENQNIPIVDIKPELLAMETMLSEVIEECVPNTHKYVVTSSITSKEPETDLKPNNEQNDKSEKLTVLSDTLNPGTISAEVLNTGIDTILALDAPSLIDTHTRSSTETIPLDSSRNIVKYEETVTGEILDTHTFIINEQIESIITSTSTFQNPSDSSLVTTVADGSGSRVHATDTAVPIIDKVSDSISSLETTKSPIHSLHDLLPEIDSIPEFKPSVPNTVLFSKLSADAPEFTPSYMYKSTTVSTSDLNEPEEILTITREIPETYVKDTKTDMVNPISMISQDTTRIIEGNISWTQDVDVQTKYTDIIEESISSSTPSKAALGDLSYSSALKATKDSKDNTKEHANVELKTEELDILKTSQQEPRETKSKRHKKKKNKEDKKESVVSESPKIESSPGTSQKSDDDYAKNIRQERTDVKMTCTLPSSSPESDFPNVWSAISEEGKSYADVVAERLNITGTEEIDQIDYPRNEQKVTEQTVIVIPDKIEIHSQEGSLDPNIIENAAKIIDKIVEQSENTIGSWAKVVGSKRSSPERKPNIVINREQVENKKYEVPHKPPTIFVDESVSDPQKHTDINIDAEGFITVDRRRSRSRSRETRSKSPSDVAKTREKSENRFEPLTVTLKQEEVEPTSSPSDEEKIIKKEKGKKVRSSKSREKELSKEIGPSTSDEDKIPLKKDKKKRSSKPKDIKLEVEPINEENKITRTELIQTESDTKKKCKKKKRDKKVEIEEVTDTPSPIELTSSEHDIPNINIKANLSPISTPESVQTPIKDRFYSEAQYWKIDPSNLKEIDEIISIDIINPPLNPEENISEIENIKLTVSQISDSKDLTKKNVALFEQGHPNKEQTEYAVKELNTVTDSTKLDPNDSQFVLEDLSVIEPAKIITPEDKISEEQSLESKMADLQREIEEMLLPENDSIISDDTPKELTDTQSPDYQYDELIENITPSLATPESEDIMDKISQTSIKQEEIIDQIETKDIERNISESMIDSVIDDTDPISVTDTLEYTSMTVDCDSFTPMEDKHPVAAESAVDINSTVCEIENEENFNISTEIPLTVDKPTNTDQTNLSNLILDHFWIEQYAINDAEVIFGKNLSEIGKNNETINQTLVTEPVMESDRDNKNSETADELKSEAIDSTAGSETEAKLSEINQSNNVAIVEGNMLNDSSFWPDKHLYHDAECQYFLLMANEKKKNTLQIESVLEISDRKDKDKDPGSSGHSSEGEEPRNRGSGELYDPNYMSMDLPGGICSWKDQTSYLSSETGVVAAEDVLTTRSVGPLARSPTSQERPADQRTTKVTDIHSYRIIYSIFYVWHDIYTKILMSQLIMCLVKYIYTTGRRSSGSANFWRAL